MQTEKKARVFVVEDEGIVAKDLESCLESLGYEVCGFATSGEEAIRRVSEFRPDLVLMDIVLEGDMDGVEAASCIRTQGGIPVIFLTAYADEATLQRARCSEPYGYVLKPFEERELFAAIEMALYKHTIEKRVREAEEEQKRLEARLQYALRHESLIKMAGGIAHNFNNLLSVILGNAEFALRELPLDPLVGETLLDIEKAARRATELIRQMVIYSGRSQCKPEPVHLPTLIQDMTPFIDSFAPKHVEVHYALDEETPWITADALQVRQILMSLFTNAAEAIGNAAGRILVSAGRMHADQTVLADTFGNEALPEGTYAYLEVTDSGSGMDTQTVGRIFDPFYTTKFPGRGLGLAAVLGMVHGHGGAVRVSSQPGKGTSLTILFPCNPPAQTPVKR